MKFAYSFFLSCFLSCFLLGESRATEPTFGNEGVYIFKVDGVLATDFEDMVELKTEHEDYRFILDCQSFLQGLNIYQQENQQETKKAELMLEGEDCYRLREYFEYYSPEEGGVCVELDAKKHKLQVGHGKETVCSKR